MCMKSKEVIKRSSGGKRLNTLTWDNFEPSKSTQYYQESDLEINLQSAVKDLGINRLVRGKSDKNNKLRLRCKKNLTEKADREHCKCTQCALYRRFPTSRVTFLCGTCSKKERDLSPSCRGCCGLLLHAKPITTSTSHPIHLVIDKFTLPETSKHALVLPDVWEKYSGPIKNENELPPRSADTIEALGAARVCSYSMKRTLKILFPDLKIEDSLLWRLVGKGGRLAFGDMALFIEKGVKWKQGGGSFEAHTSGNTLHS